MMIPISTGDYTGKRMETVDGNEYSLAVNVMAPFLLTSLLWDNVQASPAARVIITSSISQGSPHKLSDLQCASGWDSHTAYELSKLCDAMLVMEMNARYADPPRLTFNTMDPGVSSLLTSPDRENQNQPQCPHAHASRFIRRSTYC